MSNNKGKQFLEGDLLGSQHMTEQEEEKLQRSLTNRHIQMIAIGGAIGTGLFMGSGKTLSVSGTSIILTYLIIGFFFFFVMRAMVSYCLLTRTLNICRFRNRLFRPMGRFFSGWSYWCNWIITAIADVIVIGGYMQFWYPDLPVWIPAFTSLAVLTILNFVAVRLFGELEFWFSLIKITAIILFILAGIYLIGTGFTSPNGVKASMSHLFETQSMFPYGVTGFLAGFQIAIFAFVWY